MWVIVHGRVLVQSGKRDWWMNHGGLTRTGVLWDESLLYVGVWRQTFGKHCNLLTDVNHLVKVIVLVSLAVWQVCRFPHYSLSMYREGWKWKVVWKFCQVYLGEGTIYVFHWFGCICWNDSSLNIQYLNSVCIKSCHFFEHAQKG